MQQFQKDILACLQDLKGSGKFASIHTTDFLFPGLTVKGIGEIAYPVPKAQAEELIRAAHKAPFGKGSSTIVDCSVTSAWKLDADQLSFQNSNWEKGLENTMK